MRLATATAKFFHLFRRIYRKSEKSISEIAEKTDMPSENFEVVEGDIIEENLGIKEEKFEIFRKTATDVYHLAAIYDLAFKRNRASVNVEGTRNVNELSKS